MARGVSKSRGTSNVSGSAGKHIPSIDGPETIKNANAHVLKPGVQEVKGPPKSQVKKGINTAAATIIRETSN